MKPYYPDYRCDGTARIAASLPDADKQILEDFLTFCRATASDHKVASRRSEILQVRDIIEKLFAAWTLSDLRGFLAVLNQSNRKAWTKKCILITLQLFIKWKYKDWSARFNNLEDVRKLSRLLRPNNADRYNEATLPSAEEIDAMIRKAQTSRDKLYIAMAQEAGLPPKVQLTLRWENVAIDSPREGMSTLEYFRTKNREAFVVYA